MPEKGVDLANLIFRVAHDCDNSFAFKGAIDFRGVLDEMLFKVEIAKVKFDNPQLPEVEIQKIVDKLTEDHERKKAEEEAERVAKAEKIKHYINGNAVVGYALAYNLCKNDYSHEAKQLKYRLMDKIESLSIEEKLEICRIYIESLIKLGERGNDIAQVYCRMAQLVHPRKKQDDHSVCQGFYEKAYDYIDEPSWLLNEIIRFCDSFGVDELRAKCQEKDDMLQAARKKRKINK